MVNLAMKEALESGDCIDVTTIGRYDTTSDVYVLDRFIDGVDYAESPRERWIYSIGRNKSDGKILAAFDTRFYLNPEVDCLWLR